MDEQDTHSRILMLGSVIIAILLVVVLMLYLLGERYFRQHFAWNTTVNGENVSYMTAEEVQEHIAGQIDGYALLIHERDADGGMIQEAISGSDIELKMVFDDTLEQAVEAQTGGNWFWNLWSGNSLETATMVAYNKKAYEKKVQSLQCFQKEFIRKSENAHLSDYKEGVGFEIVEATYGNEPDEEKVKAMLADAINSLEAEVTLDDDCYLKPTIMADDPSLIAQKQNLEKYTKLTITYTFGETKEVLDGNTISGWLSVGKDNKVTVSEKKVEDFVASLRKKYDTIFRERSFMTSYGAEVTLDSGDYGWWMNYVKEGEELLAMIEAGESGERTPVYYQTAAQYGARDYGDTYVEVNLTAQHLFFYKDGEMVLESDFVSGNAARGLATPEGVYGITYKERNATLEGENYATPVSYWMPFNGNVGLHDATWRSQFGKKLYRSGGSHGCVNLPYLVAKQLYSMVEKGTPVICYNLKGTESDSITTQGGEEIAQAAIDAIDAIGEVKKTKACKELIERARQVYNDLSGSQKKYVNNYDKLKEAEAAYRAL